VTYRLRENASSHRRSENTGGRRMRPASAINSVIPWHADARRGRFGRAARELVTQSADGPHARVEGLYDLRERPIGGLEPTTCNGLAADAIGRVPMRIGDHWCGARVEVDRAPCPRSSSYTRPRAAAICASAELPTTRSPAARGLDLHVVAAGPGRKCAGHHRAPASRFKIVEDHHEAGRERRSDRRDGWSRPRDRAAASLAKKGARGSASPAGARTCSSHSPRESDARTIAVRYRRTRGAR